MISTYSPKQILTQFYQNSSSVYQHSQMTVWNLWKIYWRSVSFLCAPGACGMWHHPCWSSSFSVPTLITTDRKRPGSCRLRLQRRLPGENADERVPNEIITPFGVRLLTCFTALYVLIWVNSVVVLRVCPKMRCLVKIRRSSLHGASLHEIWQQPVLLILWWHKYLRKDTLIKKTAPTH